MTQSTTAIRVKRKINWERPYNLLPKLAMNDFRAKVMIQCEWSESSFYKKMQAIRTIKKLEITVLRRAFRRYNIDFDKEIKN